MRKPLLGAVCALFLVTAGASPALAAAGSPAAGTTGTASPTAAAARHHHPALGAVDFAGTVALSNCSGSLITLPDSQPTDPALVLTNGHCLETGMPGPGDVITDQSSSRTFDLLKADASTAGTLKADKVVYSTMTGTDITIYEVNQTYQQIEDSAGISPLKLSDQHPAQGTAITVVSGYWKDTYSCSVDGFAYQLKEADWTWNDSVRYTSECQVIGGTSGSPVEDSSGTVVAVNNTTNESGEQCTLDNPCEVDKDGNVTVHEGIGYAEETYIIPACFTTGNKLDLNADGCTLAKPQS